ncbi:STN domain-containing protein, partial [Bordetella hinzii]|nr:STN domain-containing protein [Bordetella hinzii]
MAPARLLSVSLSVPHSRRLARAGALTSLALALGVCAPALAQRAAPQAFQIAAAPLADALARYADQAGLTLLYEPSAVAGLKSPGLNGSYPPEQALARLLSGTSLVASRQGDGTYVLRPAPVPQLPPVSVEGESTRAEPAWTTSTSRPALDSAMAYGWSDVGKRLDPGVTFNRQNNSI